MKSAFGGVSSYLKARVEALFGMRRATSISLMIHLTLIVISMYIVLMRNASQRQTIFTGEPPRRPKLEPRKLELRAKQQDLQKQSSRPRLQPRLAAASISDIALPDINVAPQPVRQRISAKVSTFGVTGFGTGIGGGLGEGSGGGFGTSTVNFFGLKDFGQRIAILLDVSESMCEDSRGYPRGYQRVKYRIKDVLSNIGDGTFFNIIAFARAVRTCYPRMTLADPETRKQAKEWVNQFNTLEGPFGLRQDNYWPQDGVGLKAKGGSTRLDLALTAAFEQGAETIFVITDGVPWVYKFLEGKELDAWMKRKAQRRKEIEEEEANMSDAERRRRAKADADQREREEEENAKRVKKGIGPKVQEGKSRGRGGPAPPRFSDDDILKHVDMLQKHFYESKGKRRARIHVIGYAVDDRTRNFLRDLAKRNNGRFRKIRAFL